MLKEARDDDTIKNKCNTVLHDLRSKAGKNSKLNAGNINLFFFLSVSGYAISSSRISSKSSSAVKVLISSR